MMMKDEGAEREIRAAGEGKMKVRSALEYAIVFGCSMLQQ